MLTSKPIIFYLLSFTITVFSADGELSTGSMESILPESPLVKINHFELGALGLQLKVTHSFPVPARGFTLKSKDGIQSIVYNGKKSNLQGYSANITRKGAETTLIENIPFAKKSSFIKFRDSRPIQFTECNFSILVGGIDYRESFCITVNEPICKLILQDSSSMGSKSSEDYLSEKQASYFDESFKQVANTTSIEMAQNYISSLPSHFLKVTYVPTNINGFSAPIDSGVSPINKAGKTKYGFNNYLSLCKRLLNIPKPSKIENSPKNSSVRTSLGV